MAEARYSRVVVKISGSLVYPPRPDYLSRLTGVLLSLRDHARLAVVVGGGGISREYINAGARLGLNKGMQDLLGIHASRLNARILAYALQPFASPRIPEALEEAITLFDMGLIPVLGGLQPGQSTNAVALSLAEAVNADIVINLLRGINGVYDRPPNEEGARLLGRITLCTLENIIRHYHQEPGRYELLDHTALQIAKRSKTPILFTNGEDPEILAKIILEGEQPGTLVEPC